jgi:hypothetical protein
VADGQVAVEAAVAEVSEDLVVEVLAVAVVAGTGKLNLQV